MASKGLLPRVSTTKLFRAILAAGLSLLFFAEQARAIPVFASMVLPVSPATPFIPS